jgi:myo-inositol-1(or 4)-monophosphatase
MMHAWLRTILPAVQKAGQLINRTFLTGGPKHFSLKGIHNYVTPIDQQCEKWIVEAIQRHYPGHSILAEESGEHRTASSEYQWVIDPLDGTKNFVYGYPHVAISVAVQYRAQLQHGLIFDPLRNELFFASKGCGAFLNNTRLKVTSCALSEALLGAIAPTPEKPYYTNYIQKFHHVMQQAAGIRQNGSAALGLAYVAAGRLSAYLEMGLAPWDMAAGMLLVQEAGGMVLDMDHQRPHTLLAGVPMAAGETAVLSDIVKYWKQV